MLLEYAPNIFVRVIVLLFRLMEGTAAQLIEHTQIYRFGSVRKKNSFIKIGRFLLKQLYIVQNTLDALILF